MAKAGSLAVFYHRTYVLVKFRYLRVASVLDGSQVWVLGGVMNKKDQTWWRNKIERLGLKSFNQSVARWAVHIFDLLCEHPSNEYSAASLEQLSKALGVPNKFVSRAVATLTRSGTVFADLKGPVVVKLYPERLAKHKASAQSEMQPITALERRKIFEADSYRCGYCGETFLSPELEVDHIIPVSLLGADEPGNWVTLCKPDNRRKWDKFERDMLRHYRGELVEGNIQVRFRNGYFWPVINGRLRTDTREHS